MYLLLSVPAQVPSIVQVTALRKLCFLDILLMGSVQPLPAWVSSANPTLERLTEGIRHSVADQRTETARTAKIFKPMSKHIFESIKSSNPNVKLPADYEKLLKPFSYSADDLKALVECLAGSEQELRESTDWGLAQSLPRAWRRRVLERLSSVYGSIPVSDVLIQTYLESPDQLMELIEYFNAFHEMMNLPHRSREEHGFLIFESRVVKPDCDSFTVLAASIASHIRVSKG